MKRAKLPLFSFLLLALVLTASAAEKPNIIFILADDLGYGDLGCYGQKKIKTPFLDSMASEGSRYTNCYAGSAVCAPSRCVLLTGKHTGHSYIRGNKELGKNVQGQEPLGASEVTVAEVLKEAGYTTGMVGKWGLGMHTTVGDPAKQGFDYYCSVLCQKEAHDHYLGRIYEDGKLAYGGGGKKHAYQDDIFRDKALEFITKNRDTSFFMYIAYCLPHSDMQVPSLGEYKNTSWPLIEKKFAAMISHLDSNVGAVLVKLKELGIDSNTVVFFASDNGPQEKHDVNFFDSNGPLRGIKRDLWEGGIRIPMIVRWPGTVAAGAVSATVWSFWDFLPTAAEIAGGTPPDSIDGISFLPLLRGEPQTTHASLYWEFSESKAGVKQAILYGDSIKSLRFTDNMKPTVYNLLTDTAEANDLASSSSAIVARVQNDFITSRTVSPMFPIKAFDTMKTKANPPGGRHDDRAVHSGIYGFLSGGEIRFSVPRSGEVTLSVVNLGGRLLARWRHDASAGRLTTTSHPALSALPGGIYVITAHGEGLVPMSRCVPLIR